VWVFQSEVVGDADDEVAHRPGVHQFVAALGLPEPGRVNSQQTRLPGEPGPDLVEGIHTFGPWAEQNGVLRAGPAQSETN
jgi:hypothetical protein